NRGSTHPTSELCHRRKKTRMARPGSPGLLPGAALLGALSHALLFLLQLVEEPGDALSRVLIDRSRADDLASPPDLGQCLLPGVEEFGRDSPGLVAEPVRLAVEGGHVRDRPLGAESTLALGGAGEPNAGRDRHAERRREQGRPSPRPALGGGGGPR